ncbi:MAG: hypothetical protein AAF591_08785 [Verrucomicrobiota bacterium]
MKVLRLGLVLALAGLGSCGSGDGVGSDGYEVIGPKTYSSFIKNWTDNLTPVATVYIDSEEKWKTIFAPAATMAEGQVFGPEASFFDDKAIVLTARVVRQRRANEGTRYRLEGVTRRGGDLTVSVHFDDADMAGSFSIKDFIGVVVPKRDYSVVQVDENGEVVGRLDLAEGQWANPSTQIVASTGAEEKSAEGGGAAAASDGEEGADTAAGEEKEGDSQSGGGGTAGEGGE